MPSAVKTRSRHNGKSLFRRHGLCCEDLSHARCCEDTSHAKSPPPLRAVADTPRAERRRRLPAVKDAPTTVAAAAAAA
eukprot:scaffold1656_cov104-Isochrysis_galbana.AAC.3